MHSQNDSLESNAAQHRARLGSTIAELTNALNPERIANEALGTTSQLSQSAVNAAVTAARRNPAGLALVAMGAAAFLLGSGKQTASPVADPQFRGGHDTRIAKAEAKIAAKAQIETGRFSAPGASAASMRKWLDAGLDRLGPDARERVMKARLKVIDAQEIVERHTAKAATAARQAHQSQPFATVLAVAGIGALVGALLPSTRAEGNLMGAKRDQLMRQAEAVLRAEAGNLHAKGADAVRSGVRAAQDTFSSETAA